MAASSGGSAPRPPRREVAGSRRRAVVSFLIALLLLEGGLRLLLGNDAAPELLKRSRDPDVCVQPLEGASAVYSGRLERLPRTDAVVDGQGARARATQAPADGFRVVVLGDNWTFGLGVESEDTWPAIAEATLRRRRHTVEFINLAVPYQSTPQQVAWLARNQSELRPDAVLLAVSPDDLSLRDSWCVDGRRLGRPSRWLAQHVRIARALTALVRRLGPPSLPPEALEPSGDPAERFRVAMGRFGTMAQTEGFLGGVVLLTDREAFGEVPDCPSCPAAHDLIEDPWVHRLDLSPAFRAVRANRDGMLPGHEGTPSPVGHRLLGEHLADSLLGWPDLRARLGR
jgi:hypothetical protein